MILLAVPYYQTIHGRTTVSIWETLKRHSPDIDYALHNGIFVEQNQNNLVEVAKEKKASHIFFVEHDNVFDSDALERLLELDKDVVSAPYSGRKLPREPLVFNERNGELYQMSYDIWPDKPMKVYGVPTGCTLIKMSVFDKIKKPYFHREYNEDGVLISSQDIYFCKKVNEAELEVWIDPRIEVGHIGEYTY